MIPGKIEGSWSKGTLVCCSIMLRGKKKAKAFYLSKRSNLQTFGFVISLSFTFLKKAYLFGAGSQFLKPHSFFSSAIHSCYIMLSNLLSGPPRAVLTIPTCTQKSHAHDFMKF